MPRSWTIDWRTRVAVFLSYRRLKRRVYPVAKRHGIARSTVSAIVEEFRRAGFGETPRARLSPAILGRAQELHLCAVLEECQRSRPFHLATPETKLRADRGPVETTEQSLVSELPGSDDLILGDVLVWHLRGSSAEPAIQEAQQAITDYDERCWGLWSDVSFEIESESALPVVSSRDRTDGEDTAQIFDTLVDLTYKVLLRRSPEGDRKPDNWPRWGKGGASPSILTAGHVEVAVGDSEEHTAVQRAVAEFLSNKFEEYRRRARELTRLYHDLQYVQAIVEEALRQVTDEEIRKGICPECPYPEACAEPHPSDEEPNG